MTIALEKESHSPVSSALRRCRDILCVLVPAALVFSASSRAEVNPRNGNFSLTYQDVGEPDRPGPEFRRTYNSRSMERGWFGVGWGTVFETRLVAMSDGTVAVRENGSGSMTFYGQSTQEQARKSASRVGAVMARREGLDSWEQARTETRLALNSEFRALAAIQHGVLNQTLPEEPLYTPICRVGRVIPTPSGFGRVTCEGVVENFTLGGQLRGRTYLSGYAVEITQPSDLRREIRDNRGGAIIVQFDPQGQAISVAENDKVRARFRYSKSGDLIAMADGEGDLYKYTYDKLHNMTRILLIDTTTIELKYDPEGRVAAIKDRSNKTREYSY